MLRNIGVVLLGIFFPISVSAQINNPGGSGGGSGTVSSGTIGLPSFYTGTTTVGSIADPVAFNRISSGLIVDPRDTQFGSNTCTGYYGISTSQLGVGGTSYAIGDTFSIIAATPGANRATGHVTGVSGGVVTTYTIDTAGGAYNLQTGNTLATTATSGSGSGLTIKINTAASGGNDDTVAIALAEVYSIAVGGHVIAPTGCWINNLTTPVNTTIIGSAIAPTYGYDTNNVPIWFTWGSPTFGINTTGSANVGLFGFQVSGIADAGAFGTTACIGGTSMGGDFFGSRNFAINMAGHHCKVGLGTPDGAGSYILWTSINSDWSANNVAGVYGPFSDGVFLNDTIASSDRGIWISSTGGGFNRILAPRLEYLYFYGVELDAGGGQSQVVDVQTDRIGRCAVYTNNATEITVNGGALRGSGLAGTLAVTGAASHSGLIQLTVTGFGNNPSGGASATSGLVTGDVIDVSGVTGTTEANGRWTLTVIDGSHIDLQSSTFSNAYVSGGLGGVEGKEAGICVNGGSDVHAANVGVYGYSAGSHVASASVIDSVGATNVTITGGAANLGNGDTGGYQQTVANWHSSTATAPAGTIIDIPENNPCRNDNTNFTINCNTGAVAVGKSLTAGVVALSVSGSAIATNAALGNEFRVTLPHSTATAMSIPSNPVDGQKITYELIQDSTGSGTVTWNAVFNFGSIGAPTLTTTANKRDLVGFVYSTSESNWLYLGSQVAF